MKKTILVSSIRSDAVRYDPSAGHGEERERGGIRVHDREREPDYIC